MLVMPVLLAGCTASASVSTTPPAPPADVGMCTPDSSVDCASGTTGYSCPSGSDAPDQTDTTLVCSVPVSANGADEYCCYTNTITASGSTCEQDPSVGGCMPDSAGNPSYGFSCTGADTPDMDYSNISCSSGTTGQMDAQGDAATTYCCTYQ
jgi:hypothetical protein